MFGFEECKVMAAQCSNVVKSIRLLISSINGEDFSFQISLFLSSIT